MVDLPTTLPGQLSLAATGTVLSAADTTTALAGTGTGDVLTAALPTSVQSLAGVSVTGYGLLFSAAGDQPTTTTVSLAFGADVWSPVAALPLAISGLTLTGTADLLERRPRGRARLRGHSRADQHDARRR